MQAEYDSRARALGITVVDNAEPRAQYGDEVGPGCVVAVDDRGRAVDVELLDPEEGLGSLKAAAERYHLDHEALVAAARAALAAPDRPVTVDVGARSAA